MIKNQIVSGKERAQNTYIATNQPEINMSTKFSDLSKGEKFEFIYIDETRVAGTHIKVTRLTYRLDVEGSKRRPVGFEATQVRPIHSKS